MINFVEEAISLTANFRQDEFVNDRRTYGATLRNLELIGEAANRIPEEVRAANPHIQWRQVVALRDRLAHDIRGLTTM
ncbi:MAG: DUF86 domain-containing protein [Acidimicrobiaceae bacterium]|nr:DUF86 domain-containing protein [Acidimicrobiaceae bacterium]